MDCFVHALFNDEKKAAAAVEALVAVPFDGGQISALMREGGHAASHPAGVQTGVAPGAALGAVLGVAGTSLLAAAGFLVAGPLAALIGGGVAGAAFGATGGLGHWQEKVDLHTHVEGGMILVGVSTPPERVDDAIRALRRASPDRVHVSSRDEACREVETGVLT